MKTLYFQKNKIPPRKNALIFSLIFGGIFYFQKLNKYSEAYYNEYKKRPAYKASLFYKISSSPISFRYSSNSSLPYPCFRKFHSHSLIRFFRVTGLPESIKWLITILAFRL